MFSLLRLTILFLLSPTLSEAASAQSILDRARRAAERGAERAVEREVSRGADRATTAAIGAAGDAVRCAFTDERCIEDAQRRGENVVLTDAEGRPVDAEGRPAAAANYNFTPGERTLLANDFTRDYVSDFPRDFEFVSGNAEVVAIANRRALRLTDEAVLRVPLPDALPNRFTIEFDYFNENRHAHLRMIPESTSAEAYSKTHYSHRFPHHYFVVSPESGGTGVVAGNAGLPESTTESRAFMEGFARIEITVDDGYAKMYVNGARVANVPNSDVVRGDHLLVAYFGSRGHGYIADLRVASGGNDLYAALQAEGRVVTEGIYFDTASATLTPESFAVGQEIAAMMASHPALRILIEGHTDAQGNPTSNQRLSEERAAAVASMLMSLGVAADRLESAGMGQTQPVAPNDTAEGRAKNRRVELVRL